MSSSGLERSRSCDVSHDLYAVILASALVIDFGLISVYLFSYVEFGAVLRPFDLDGEGNIPAWWSSFQLLGAGLAFGLVAFRNLLVRTDAFVAAGLSAVLILMSLDETASLHEQFGFVIDLVLGSRAETSFNRTGLWFVVVGVPFVILFYGGVSIAYRFFRTVPGTTIRLCIGMGLLLTGALIVEAITNFLGDGETYHLGAATEEGLEMCGGSVLLWSSIVFLFRHPSMAGLLTQLKPLERHSTASS